MSNDPQGPIQTERILGLSFFAGTLAAAVDHHAQHGGYIVIPAAPALLKLNYDDDYRRAMQGADLVLADSGLLAVLWRMAGGGRLKPISGLSYFKRLFEDGGIKAGQPTFWLFASVAAKEKAARWLGDHGLLLRDKDCMIATMPSSSAQDYAILVKIEEEKPKHVVIAMAGGGQEKLALYLRDYLLYRPSIHCIGAALDFLSGEQCAIPVGPDAAISVGSRESSRSHVCFFRVSASLSHWPA
jgi:UDP-N-acetyl-D-mannosaminuronic acid transferase (WecB/TagA/CpsF family)